VISSEVQSLKPIFALKLLTDDSMSDFKRTSRCPLVIDSRRIHEIEIHVIGTWRDAQETVGRRASWQQRKDHAEQIGIVDAFLDVLLEYIASTQELCHISIAEQIVWQWQFTGAHAQLICTQHVSP
jgi:hypothetical protein